MLIPSGSTDRGVYFSAGETGLATWTIYLSRNGAARAAMTTPTVTEIGDGDYFLLLDEGTTLDAGHDTEELLIQFEHAGIDLISRAVTLYRPVKTEGRALAVTATGAVAIDWGNVENPTTAVNLSGTTVGGGGGGGSSGECPCPCPGDQMLHPHLQ